MRPPEGAIPCLRRAALLPAGLLLSALGLLPGACSDSAPRQASLTATIVRIEEPAGEFFSPRLQGPSRPLTKIYLRAAEAGGYPLATLVIVAVLGPYEPERLGGPGDVVRLTYPGPIVPGRELPFEDILTYRVIRRGGGPPG